MDIEEEQLSFVDTYKKFNEFMNSSFSFLSELEKMKSCIHRVEAANVGIGL